jgi:hypothetical protein
MAWRKQERAREEAKKEGKLAREKAEKKERLARATERADRLALYK